MSEKDKISKTKLSDFLRYRKNVMPEKERNAFERELQRDPFAEEAAEGFAMIGPAEAEADIAILNKKLRAGISRNRRINYYRIAASVAVLMIISSVFIIFDRNQPAGQLAETAITVPDSEIKTMPAEIVAPEPIIKPEISAISEKAEIAEPAENSEMASAIYKTARKAGTIQNEAAEKLNTNMGKEEEKIAEIAGAISREYVKPAAADLPPGEKLLAAEQPEALMPARGKSIKASSEYIYGRVISSEDGEPIPGVTVMVKGTKTGTITDMNGNFSLNRNETEEKPLVVSFIGMDTKEFIAQADSENEIKLDPDLTSLSEIVVVGYGVKSKMDEGEYIPPQPEGGRVSYDRYIAEKMQKPAIMEPGQKVVVVINLTIL